MALNASNDVEALSSRIHAITQTKQICDQIAPFARKTPQASQRIFMDMKEVVVKHELSVSATLFSVLVSAMG